MVELRICGYEPCSKPLLGVDAKRKYHGIQKEKGSCSYKQYRLQMAASKGRVYEADAAQTYKVPTKKRPLSGLTYKRDKSCDGCAYF